MNLKEMKNSSNDTVPKKEKRQLISNDTMQKSKQPNVMDLVQKQSATIQYQQKKLTRQNQTIQKLSSEKSNLTSTIAKLQEELSSTQKINQKLVKQNDDLRNNNGLKTKKEVEDILAKSRDIQIQNSKLIGLVNKSNIEAVDRANAERDEAIKDADRAKADMKKQCSLKVRQAEKGKEAAIRRTRKAEKTLKKRSFLAYGLLAFTLFCAGIMNKLVRNDFLMFFKVLLCGLFEILSAYANFMMHASDTMAIGTAWFMRILLTILLLIGTCVCFKLISLLVSTYKKRWCTLSLKVLVVSLAVIEVFGPAFRSIVSINLVLLFFLTQIGYLILLRYLDDYYEMHNRTDEWRRKQNR